MRQPMRNPELQLRGATADGLPMSGRERHGNRRAALWVACLVTLSSILSPSASASSPEAGERGRYRAECRKLTKQINHYEGTILPMAIERGNRPWENATNDHIERLWHRRADLCPAYGAERTLMAKAADEARRFNQFLAAAGRAAAQYFSGGLMP